MASGFAGSVSAQVVCDPPPSLGALDPVPVTEIVFIIDGSGSISGSDWAILKDALISQLNDRRVFPLDGSVAVGAVQFSTAEIREGGTPIVQNLVCLTQIRSLEDITRITRDIASMRLIGSGTASGSGIQAAAELLLTTGRPTTLERRMCLLTDGAVNSGVSTTAAAAQAEANGIERLAIAALQDLPHDHYVDSFLEADAEAEYGAATFGGGLLSFATSSAEFAVIFGPTCMGNPVRLVAFEINQSVQDWQDSIPLVAGKPTIARVFVEPTACLSGSDLDTVTTTARLSASRGGVALGESLLPINSNVSAVFDCTPASNRAQPQASLNFRLPEEWLSGNIDLEITFLSGIDCGDGPGVVSSCTKSVSFESTSFPAVTLLSLPSRVLFDPRNPTRPRPVRTPTTADLIEQKERTNAMLPTADFRADFEYFKGIVGAGASWRQDSGGNWNRDRLDERVLRRISWYFWRSYCSVTDGCTTRRVHGLANGGAGIVGVSNPTGVGISLSTLGYVGSPLAVGHYRNTATHEFSHNFGVPHTTNGDQFGISSSGNPVGPCGSVALPANDPSYPDLYFDSNFITRDMNRNRLNNVWGWRATLGPLAFQDATNPRNPDDEIWGVATNISDPDANPGLAIPDSAFDWALMSYCPRTLGRSGQLSWISSTNYRNIFNTLQSTPFDAPLVVGRPNLQSWVVTAGSIDPATEVVTFEPAYALPGPGPFEVEPGEYTVELRDVSGAVLESVSFTPRIAEPDVPDDPDTFAELGGEPNFFVTLPQPTTSVAELVVLRGTTELGRVSASASAPSVAIVEPATGTVFDGEFVRFEWAASDDDGDELHHAIDYSNDNGATWVPLAVDVVDVSFEVGREWIRAGASSRMRITTTDGLRSTTVVSGAFSVANNAPIVVIASPEDGQAFASAQRISLHATAFDREDGHLGGESVEWFSSRDGSLGFGTTVEVGAEELEVGEHLIVARGVDSEGETGGNAARIFVSRVPPLVRVEPDFTLRLDPASQTINPGASVIFRVFVTSLNDFADPVDLSIMDLPAGWTASFDLITVTPDGVSELTITAPASATETGIPVVVQGTSGSLVHTTVSTAELVFGLIPECFGRIAGTIRDVETGLPVEGAESTPVFPAAVSDAAGYFTTVDLTVREWPQVRITADGYYPETLSFVPVRCNDVTLLDIELVPVLTGSLIGRVVVGIADPDDTSESRDVTPTETPIIGAVVRAPEFTTTDANGNYLLLDLPLRSGTNAPQTYSFTASAEGYWDQRKLATVNKDVPVSLDFELVERCDFVLTGGGLVVDETGAPVAGAQLRWPESLDPTVFATSGLDGRFEMPEGIATPGYQNSRTSEIALIVAPPSGGAGFPGSFFQIRVENRQSADQCGLNRLDDYLVTIEEIIIPVERFARFQGRVRDAVTGEPIAGAEVTVRPTGIPGGAMRSDSNGFYDIEVSLGSDPNATEEVRVSSFRTSFNWGTTTGSFMVVPDQVYVRDLDLSPIIPITVEGVIRDRETRLPVVGLDVSYGSGVNAVVVASDENGRYRIEGIDPGDQNTPGFFTISSRQTASSPSGTATYYLEFATLFGESGQTLIHNFNPLRRCDGGSISGVVVNAETLEPLEDARVSITGFVTDLTDIDGRFRLENIIPRDQNGPREVVVRAVKTGFVTASKQVTVYCGAELFLEFGTPPGGLAEIFGTVTEAASGAPLEGIFVGSAFGKATTTDEFGEYRLSTAPLAPDGGSRVWQISATRGLDTLNSDVTVQSSAPTRQDFEFASEPALGIQVGDETTSFDPRTRTLTSRATLILTNATGQVITGPLAATILIDRVGVTMSDVTSKDADGNPVFLIVEAGVDLAVDAAVSIDLLFLRTTPQAFLYDVQVTLGDPSNSSVGATSSIEGLVVFPRQADRDGDRWHDALDLCPTRPDPEQLDLDGNGVGDACEDLVSTAGPNPIPDPSPVVDMTPLVAHSDWIRLAGTAPDGATTVELGDVSTLVDAEGRFEVASPVLDGIENLDLIFKDEGDWRMIRSIGIRVVPIEAEGR